MSFLTCTINFVINEDGTSVFTTKLDRVMTKCMQSLTPYPGDWICNAIHNRARIEGERIYKMELERHLETGTLPTNITIESLILDYEIPVPDPDTDPDPETDPVLETTTSNIA